MAKTIHVSSAMSSEGLRVFEELKDSCPACLLVAEIYIAMALADRQDSARAKGGTDGQAVPASNADSGD
jgi:hypothetical protein